jgi:hypothetical protein
MRSMRIVIIESPMILRKYLGTLGSRKDGNGILLTVMARDFVVALDNVNPLLPHYCTNRVFNPFHSRGSTKCSNSFLSIGRCTVRADDSNRQAECRHPSLQHLRLHNLNLVRISMHGTPLRLATRERKIDWEVQQDGGSHGQQSYPTNLKVAAQVESGSQIKLVLVLITGTRRQRLWCPKMSEIGRKLAWEIC